jgi:hypothetical protein
LINEYKKGLSIKEIAKIHQRKKGAIRSRLRKTPCAHSLNKKDNKRKWMKATAPRLFSNISLGEILQNTKINMIRETESSTDELLTMDVDEFAEYARAHFHQNKS